MGPRRQPDDEHDRRPRDPVLAAHADGGVRQLFGHGPDLPTLPAADTQGSAAEAACRRRTRCATSWRQTERHTIPQ